MSGAQGQRRWEPFRDLSREVGRLFETLEPWPTWRIPRPFPAINLYDADDCYVLTAELPGMTPEGIDLSLTGETLTLRGERQRPEGIADESYRRQERPFGRWSRTVPLPGRVDGARVTADVAHGILTVILPKAEAVKPRQITVTATPVPPAPGASTP
jgi:HSP20 family protein